MGCDAWLCQMMDARNDIVPRTHPETCDDHQHHHFECYALVGLCTSCVPSDVECQSIHSAGCFILPDAKNAISTGITLSRQLPDENVFAENVVVVPARCENASDVCATRGNHCTAVRRDTETANSRIHCMRTVTVTGSIKRICSARDNVTRRLASSGQ